MSSLLFWRRTLKVGHLTPYNVHKWMRSSKLVPLTRLSKLTKMFQMEAKFKKKHSEDKNCIFPVKNCWKSQEIYLKITLKHGDFLKTFTQFVFYTVKVYTWTVCLEEVVSGNSTKTSRGLASHSLLWKYTWTVCLVKAVSGISTQTSRGLASHSTKITLYVWKTNLGTLQYHWNVILERTRSVVKTDP